MAILRRVLGLVGFVVVGFGVVGLVWAASGPDAGSDSGVALNAHPSIEVLEEPFVSFSPAGSKIGLVLFPDVRVEAAAYAPLARVLAERNILVVVVEPVFRIPFLSPSAPSGVFEEFPDVELWAVGGHGAGGRTAARYVSEHVEVDALVLLGAITSERTDLRESGADTLSIVGSHDGFVSVGDVEASSPRMPYFFEIAPLDGGNHAFFGDYGEVGRDGEATLTPSEQRNRTAELVTRFLSALYARSPL